MAIETYEQAVAFGSNRTDYESIGMPTDPGGFTLDRIRTLLRQLGNPERQFEIVHVAGTKGKGSTSAMIAAIMRQAGYRTGLFTSPHLANVEERVQVDGEPISRADFIGCMSEIEAAVQAIETGQQVALTFFEILTALGFLHFARMGIALAVVEVGLGGRLDSTNVCTPIVSVLHFPAFRALMSFAV